MSKDYRVLANVTSIAPSASIGKVIVILVSNVAQLAHKIWSTYSPAFVTLQLDKIIRIIKL